MDRRTFAQVQEVMAAQLPGYTRRTHQEELAKAVERVIDEEKPGLLQGGCGVGKSFAGLIPAIESGKRVIVATATKALQTQYMGDLTFLEEHLRPFRWAVLKGRSNYPCHYKIDQLGAPTRAQQAVLGAMDGILEADEEAIPDREMLPTIPDREWMDLSMSAAECPGKKRCPFAKQCLTEKAKDKAAAAQVVVTNHAYLMQDAILSQRSDGAVSLLGEYGLLIADEGHNLPDKATDALSDRIGQNGLRRLGDDIDGFLSDQGRDTGPGVKVFYAARTLWQALADQVDARNRGNRERVPVRLMPADVLALAGRFTELAESIQAAREHVLAVRGLDPEDPGYVLRYRLLNRCEDWYGRIAGILIGENMVTWLEEDTIPARGAMPAETRLFLRTAPLSAGPFLREQVWGRGPAILLSATLTTGTDRQGRPDFTFIREACGLEPGEAVEFDAGTPFDFRKQARLYVPAKGIPEPVRDKVPAWRAYCQQATSRLVTAADGNALLLYTSRANMELAYQSLAPAFREQGLLVLKQGDGASPGELIAQLKTGRAVLFGLKTFFEGVDVQGDAVRLVVIDKLPFVVPTDILFQARCQDEDRRHGEWASFRNLSLPIMKLTLIQGFGRLIRHAGDQGVVAILDPRMSSKGYGRQIIASLPPAPVTTDMSEAVAFLESTR